jgi:hypothetical protein
MNALMQPLYAIQEMDLTAEEAALVKAKLWELLGKQTEHYAGGDSSVDIETAEALLKSIGFTLSLGMKEGLIKKRDLLNKPLSSHMELCRELIRSKMSDGKRLLSKLRAVLTVSSYPMEETLYEIEAFFKRYNWYFLAHDIPAMIDYQLSQPVPESLEGIEFINEYLNRFLIEADFISKYSKTKAEALLTACYHDYSESVLNLYEPLAANALGSALLGRSGAELTIKHEDKQAFAKLFSALTDNESLKLLNKAAVQVIGEIKSSSEETAAYLYKTAHSLLPRIKAVLESGNFHGIYTELPYSK